MDIKLVQSQDLKILPKSAMNYLQFLASLHTRMLETDGDWSKIQKLLKGLFPVTGKAWIFNNVRKQDWSVLQTEKLNLVIADQTTAVPKFRLLPENYRLASM